MAYTTTVARELAGLADAYHRCLKTGNEWAAKHRERAEYIARNYLPSGSGIDTGTTFDIDASTGERLVLRTEFHHMNDGGYYDGWTQHDITVKASLIHGLALRIGGRNRNDIKEYLHDVFREALGQSFDPHEAYAQQVGAA